MNTEDPQGQSQTPSSTSEVTAGEKNTQNAPKQDLPEKLQGKDAAEIAKMYAEAERKLGEAGNELGQHRKFQQEMAVVLQAINADSDLKASVEKQLRKMAGDEPDKPEKNIGERKSDDTRKVVEAQVIQQFEQRVGLNALTFEEKEKVYKKIGDELLDILDPSGNKSYNEVLDSVDLSRLPRLLDKAYILATQDSDTQKQIDEAVARARENSEGMIGNIPSSGGNSTGQSLTADQQKVARRLGISDEDYLKSLREINEESKRP